MDYGMLRESLGMQDWGIFKGREWVGKGQAWEDGDGGES